MNMLKKVMLIGVSIVVISSFTACNKPGETEKMEKKMDDTTTKMEDATPKMDEQSEKVEEVTEGAASTTEGETAAEAAPVTEGEGASDDAAITSQVEAAIAAEPSLSSLQISVSTAGGEVTLSGTVKVQQDIDKAEEIASAIEGVTKVTNELVLESTN